MSTFFGGVLVEKWRGFSIPGLPGGFFSSSTRETSLFALKGHLRNRIPASRSCFIQPGPKLLAPGRTCNHGGN